MSGVYINMEMPSGCGGCYFLLDCGICCMLMAADCKHKAVGEYRWEENERHPDCPLIHVPDHGRLIDAFDTVRTLCNKGLYMHAEIVSDMPTIIPAERGEKDGS